MEAVLSPKPSDAESAEVVFPTHKELCQRLHAIVESKKQERLGLIKPSPLVLNGVSLVHRTSDGYIDATSMCQAMNKRKDIQAWYRNQSTQNFLTELSIGTRILVPNLVIFGKSTNYGRDTEHTWVHRKVAYHLAMWLSPKFAVQVYNWLDELFACGKVELYAEKSIEEVESIYMTQLADVDRQLTQLSTENKEARLAICAKDAELAALKSFDAQEAARLAVLVQQQFSLETYKLAQVVYLIYLGYFKAPGDTVERHWFKLGQSDRVISDDARTRTRIKYKVYVIRAMSAETNTIPNSCAQPKRGRGRPRKYPDDCLNVKRDRDVHNMKYNELKESINKTPKSQNELYEKILERSRLWQKKHRETVKSSMVKTKKLQKLIEENKVPQPVLDFLKEHELI